MIVEQFQGNYLKHYLRLRPEQYCIEVKRGIMDWFLYTVNNISRKLNITSEL